MNLYVDGNDLLEHLAEHGDPMVASADPERRREALARWLARYCEARDCEAVLVFDQTPFGDVRAPTERHGKATVLNLPYGEDAWTEIAGPANRSAVDERTFVVTADRRLIRALERGRATVQSPGQFMAGARKLIGKAGPDLAQEPDEKFTGLSDAEVEYWLRYFEEED